VHSRELDDLRSQHAAELLSAQESQAAIYSTQLQVLQQELDRLHAQADSAPSIARALSAESHGDALVALRRDFEARLAAQSSDLERARSDRDATQQSTKQIEQQLQQLQARAAEAEAARQVLDLKAAQLMKDKSALELKMQQQQQATPPPVSPTFLSFRSLFSLCWFALMFVRLCPL
jgi:hypothetical protein